MKLSQEDVIQLACLNLNWSNSEEKKTVGNMSLLVRSHSLISAPECDVFIQSTVESSDSNSRVVFVPTSLVAFSIKGSQ